MVTLATREYLPLLDNLHHLRRKPRLRMIRDTYNNKSQFYNYYIL